MTHREGVSIKKHEENLSQHAYYSKADMIFLKRNHRVLLIGKNRVSAVAFSANFGTKFKSQTDTLAVPFKVKKKEAVSAFTHWTEEGGGKSLFRKTGGLKIRTVKPVYLPFTFLNAK